MPCKCGKERHEELEGQAWPEGQVNGIPGGPNPRICWLYANPPLSFEDCVKSKQQSQPQDVLVTNDWDRFIGEEEAKPPGIFQKAANLVTAVAQNIAQGCPTRSQEEQDRIFETYCKPCDAFEPTTQSCKLCGCLLRGMIFNKIRMKTEKCPKGLW